MFLAYDHHLCGEENRWPRIFFLMSGNKKKSLDAKSGLCGGWPISSTFWPVKKTWFEPMCENSHCHWEQWFVFLVRFSNCREDFRQTNFGVALRIDRPTMLKWNSRHITSFTKQTGDHNSDLWWCYDHGNSVSADDYFPNSTMQLILRWCLKEVIELVTLPNRISYELPRSTLFTIRDIKWPSGCLFWHIENIIIMAMKVFKNLYFSKFKKFTP